MELFTNNQNDLGQLLESITPFETIDDVRISSCLNLHKDIFISLIKKQNPVIKTL